MAGLDDDGASQAPSSLGFGGTPADSKSSDASPFHVAQEDDQYGGARPWNKYRKVRDPETDSQVRVPEGKVCLICFSTFRGLGYHYKYGSYNAYYQQIRDNAAAHSEFLASVKEFISQKNDNPKMRIDKAALKQAGTTLHSETKSGVRFEGPEMEFVMLEHWDPKLDGQLDETKVVEETWKGKKVKGVWRQVGRQGVLKAHGYEDTNMTERTEEHSGTGPFAEQGLATKKQVLQSVFADADEQRRKHAVASPTAPAPAEIMATLQQLLPGLRQAQGSEAAPSQSEGATAQVEVPDDEEEEEAEEEEVCPALRLAASVGGPMAAKAAAKASAKAKQGAAPAAKSRPAPRVPAQQPKVEEARQQVAEKGEVAAKPDTKATSRATKASPGETLQLDGRGKRLKENLAEIYSKQLQSLVDNHLEVNFSIQDVDAKQIYSKKSKALNTLLNAVSKQAKKIEESVNKAGLLEELENFQRLQDVTSALVNLFARLNTANPAAQDLAEAVEACESSCFDVKLGPAVWHKMLSTRAAHFCLYQDFTAYSQLFRTTQKEAWLDRNRQCT